MDRVPLLIGVPKGFQKALQVLSRQLIDAGRPGAPAPGDELTAQRVGALWPGNRCTHTDGIPLW